MKRLVNSRQMPKERTYMADTRFSDRVYAWLQVHSEKEGDVRWVHKSEASFETIASELKLSRQTVSKRMKALMEMGLVIYNKQLKRYELILLENDIAMLIEKNTLREMMSAMNDNTINIYVYLLNRYLINEEKPFDFTLEQVKMAIGLKLSKNNNYIITDILNVLQRQGGLEYDIQTRYDEDNYRTHYRILTMSNRFG